MALFPDWVINQMTPEERQEWEEASLPDDASEAYQAAKYDFDLKLLIARIRAGAATRMEIDLAMDFLEGKIKRRRGAPPDPEMEKRNVKIHGFIFNKLCKGEKMEAALEAGKKQFDLKRSAVYDAYQSARKAYIKSGDDPFFWSVEHRRALG